MKKSLLKTLMAAAVSALVAPFQSRNLAYETAGHDDPGQPLFAGAQKFYRDVKKHVDGSERARKERLATIVGTNTARIQTEGPDDYSAMAQAGFGQQVETRGEQRC